MAGRHPFHRGRQKLETDIIIHGLRIIKLIIKSLAATYRLSTLTYMNRHFEKTVINSLSCLLDNKNRMSLNLQWKRKQCDRPSTYHLCEQVRIAGNTSSPPLLHNHSNYHPTVTVAIICSISYGMTFQ